jgi:hypothetical protein
LCGFVETVRAPSLQGSLPQWFLLPGLREAHGIEVNGWVVSKQPKQFIAHVVLRRNNIKEILDDAQIRTFFHPARVYEKYLFWELFIIFAA